MGMDVFGIAPTAEVGEYFGNTCWEWRPLANYLTASFPDETEGCVYWQSNDGDGLTAEQCTALAVALKHALHSGAVAEYEAAYRRRLEGQPTAPCQFCGGFGRRIWPRSIRECNACGGSGQEPARESYYPFSEENVSEFYAFLTHCGGFKIW